MARSFSVSVVTPEEEIFSGDAELVIARSPEGEFGIMNGHVPFLAALVPGLVTVVSGGSRSSYIVPAGFLEASGSQDDYHVIVLADDADEAGDVDAGEAKRRIAEAQRAKEEDVEQRAEAGMRAAMAGTQLGRD